MHDYYAIFDLENKRVGLAGATHEASYSLAVEVGVVVLVALIAWVVITKCMKIYG